MFQLLAAAAAACRSGVTAGKTILVLFTYTHNAGMLAYNIRMAVTE